MADDVNIKDIDLLKSYSSKLNELKDASIAVTVLIYRQVEKIKEDLRLKQIYLQNLKDRCDDKCDDLSKRYDSAIQDVGDNARYIIGTSDEEAKRINGMINQKLTLIEQNIGRLQVLLDNAFQHTKNYGLQMSNMVDSCRNSLQESIQTIEDYKKQL